MKKLMLIISLLIIPAIAIAQTAEEYFEKGNAKIDKTDYRGAIQDYNKAIELNPNHANAYFARGLAKRKLGDYRGAIQDFDKTIELDSDLAPAYANRGLAKIGLGQKNSGCLDLSKAAKLGYLMAESSIKDHCQ